MVSLKTTEKCVMCDADLSGPIAKGAYFYLTCVSCETSSLRPMPTLDVIEAHYKAKFDEGNYELARRFSEGYLPIHRGYLDVILKRLALESLRPNGMRLMEVGCFTGEFLNLARNAGFDVSGYELQDEAVLQAQRLLPGRIRKIDINDKALDDEMFDVVCLFGVVEHVRDPKGLIRRCVQLLRPGGLIFIETPDRGSLPARCLGRFWPPYAPVEHLNLLTRKALRDCLASAGCRRFEAYRHWKTLPIEYVYEMMRHFGPELRPLIEPFYRLIPQVLRSRALPFYVGETLVFAQKDALK